LGLFGSKDKGGESSRLAQSGQDATQLVIDYVKQETLEPLQGVGRFLIFGIVGSLALCVGVVLVLVGFLRLLQTETGSTFTGDLSWLPYVIVAVPAVAMIGLATWRVTAGPAAPRLPEPEKEKT
jgi:hypothetical protein